MSLNPSLLIAILKFEIMQLPILILVKINKVIDFLVFLGMVLDELVRVNKK